MMVIRPVERSDISALMQLASKTGGGLTSLPPRSHAFGAYRKGNQNLARRTAQK